MLKWKMPDLTAPR